MNHLTELENTINDMVQKGRGVLAADERSLAIVKRFKAIEVESIGENRRAMHVWMGKSENVAAVQAALLKRARLNHLTILGEYKAEIGISRLTKV